MFLGRGLWCFGHLKCVKIRFYTKVCKREVFFHLSARNMSGKTRSSKSKRIEALRKKDTDTDNAVNNSYITIIADDGDDDRTETPDFIMTTLRNELADVQNSLQEKVEIINSLNRDIGLLTQRLKEQENHIRELENTVNIISKKDDSHRTFEVYEVCSNISRQIAIAHEPNLTLSTDEAIEGRAVPRESSTPLVNISEGAPDDSVPTAGGTVTTADAYPTEEDLTEVAPVLEDCEVRDSVLISEVTPCSVPGRLPKMLLLADDRGGGLSSGLSAVLRGKYFVETIFKPNAFLLDVIMDAPMLTRSFDKHDYLIILAGTNDVLGKSNLNKRDFDNIINKLSHTNVVILTVPYRVVKGSYNDEAYAFNDRLYRYCSNKINNRCSGVYYCDVNSLFQFRLIRGNLYLSRREKSRLTRYIRDVVQYTNNVSSNTSNTVFMTRTSLIAVSSSSGTDSRNFPVATSRLLTL